MGDTELNNLGLGVRHGKNWSKVKTGRLSNTMEARNCYWGCKNLKN